MSGPVVRPALVPTWEQKLILNAMVDGPATDDVMKFNGVAWVHVPEGTSFAYSVASFSDGQSSPQLIGVGVWKAAGALTFTVSYNNGPPTTAFIPSTGPGWEASLDLSDPFTSVVSAEATNYPAAPGSIDFDLLTMKNAELGSAAHTINFWNYIYYGVLAKNSAIDESDIESLTPGSSPEISNTKGRTITVAPGSGEYIVYALPSRLGDVTFTVNGFTGGFTKLTPAVSVTNSADFTEDYDVYVSDNANLGSTTVVVA